MYRYFKLLVFFLNLHLHRFFDICKQQWQSANREYRLCRWKDKPNGKRKQCKWNKWGKYIQHRKRPHPEHPLPPHRPSGKCTGNSSVIEQNAYYPFGSRHTFGSTYAQTTNRFKFNGKEEQTTGNLNYLDYGARMYDSNIGRWMVQDPLSEKYYAYSQYSFSGNNPILNIDSDGKAWDTFIDAAF